jgi:peptidoglycan/LPS O-acetylase OafA/YrhL
MLNNRVFGLDLFRALAVMTVMISHLGFHPQYVGGLRIGQLGVELFFVLSGFLIGQILIKEFSKDISVPVILNFWVRRWFRTLPVYYLVLLIKFIFIDHSLGYKVLVYFFFLQNNFVGISFLVPSWSLVIEEWFYLSLPILLWICFFKRAFTAHRLMIFIVGFIVAENILRYVWVWKTNTIYDGINGNFPFRLDSLMYGVLLANLKLSYRKVYNQFTKWKVFIPAVGLYSLLLIAFGTMNLVKGNIDLLVWPRTIWFSINSLCIALILPFFDGNPILNNNKRGIFVHLITWISLISYSSYLIHLDIFVRIVSAPIFTRTWLLQGLIAFSITFVLSYLLFRFYEKPMMDLRDRIKPKKLTHETPILISSKLEVPENNS